MRAIATEAGVDAALITHFFGSKANLLGAAIDWPFDLERELPRLLSAGGDHAGERLVALFVRTWDEEGSRHPVITLLRAAMNEPSAADLLADFMRARYILRFEPLASAQPRDVVRWVAPGVQRYLTGPL